MLKPHYLMLFTLLACQPAGLPNDGPPEPQPSVSIEPTSEPTTMPTPASSPAPTPLPVDVAFNTPIEMLSSPTYVFPDGLRLGYFLEGDSRCPRNATCIWAGEVSLALRLQKEGEAPADSQSLTLGGGDESATLSWEGYDITLFDVQPYPEQTAEPKPVQIVATIQVSPR